MRGVGGGGGVVVVMVVAVVVVCVGAYDLIIPSFHKVARGYRFCPVRTYAPFVIAQAPTFLNGFKRKLHTNAGYDNISTKFDFQGAALKIKGTVAIFRKTLSSL